MSLAPIDLVQLRWQQIRVVEAAHVTERENISLRKKIKEVQSSSARIGGEALKKFISHFKAYTIKHKLELNKLKIGFVKDINDAMHATHALKEALNKTIALLDQKEVTILEMKAENRLQRTQLSAAKHEASEAAKAHEAEKAKLQARIDKLMAEKVDSAYTSERIKTEEARKQKAYDDLLAAKNKLEASHEALLNETKRLKGVIATLQEEYSRSMEGMQNMLNQQQQEASEKITGMGQDIEYLRGIISEQEEQIQRLSSQLIGNKSHFAKFVEIKSENINLQAKLDAMTNKSSKKFGRLGSGPVQLPNLNATNSGGGSSRDVTAEDGGEGQGLPAYQKMKARLAMANSIAKVMSNEGGVSGEEAMSVLNDLNRSIKAAAAIVPVLPIESAGGYDEAGYVVNNRSPRGNPLSSESSSRKLPTKDSARSMASSSTEPHFNFKPPVLPVNQQAQQPRPPPADLEAARPAGDSGKSFVRKSLRVENASPVPVPVVTFAPDLNPSGGVGGQPSIKIPKPARDRMVI